MTYCRSWFVRS